MSGIGLRDRDGRDRLSMATEPKVPVSTKEVQTVEQKMALDISKSTVAPDDCTHLPGIANKAADSLSRLDQPGRTTPLPQYLSPELKWEVSHHILH